MKEKDFDKRYMAWCYLGAFILMIVMCINMISSTQESIGTTRIGSCVDLPQGGNYTTCIIKSIQYPSPNSTVVIVNFTMSNDGGMWIYSNFCDTNQSGMYTINSECDGTIYPYTLTVTKSGYDTTTTDGIFYIVLIIFLLFLIGSCVYGFVKFENLLGRVSLIGLIYLFLTVTFFVAWRMTDDFTNNDFLINFFNIIWTFLMYAAFPILIGGFVYYFLSITKIKEIQNLMEKGFSLEEAEERVRKR